MLKVLTLVEVSQPVEYGYPCNPRAVDCYICRNWATSKLILLYGLLISLEVSTTDAKSLPLRTIITDDLLVWLLVDDLLGPLPMSVNDLLGWMMVDVILDSSILSVLSRL